jgi:hypothetical protein
MKNCPFCDLRQQAWILSTCFIFFIDWRSN